MKFEEACELVLETERETAGIGTMQEKTLHSVLKFYLEPDESLHEVRVGRHIADICEPDGTIFEIQSANFDKLRDKLTEFLPEHHVIVVYPGIAAKRLYWIREGGEVSEGRKVNRTGNQYQIFNELSKIRTFLTDPNLTIEVILMDVDEYRLQDGWGSGGKRGAHRWERIPTGLAGEYVLEKREDYLVHLMPAELPEEWTVAQYAKRQRQTPRIAERSMLVYLALGFVEREKIGRTFHYRLTQETKDALLAVRPRGEAESGRKGRMRDGSERTRRAHKAPPGK